MASPKQKQSPIWSKIRTASSWYFVVGLVVSLGLAIVSLRNNNLTALQFRDRVNQVDKDNGDVEAALKELREYVYGHMNTNLSDGPNAIKPPIQLKYRYERLWQAANVTPDNSKVYTDAQSYCEKTQPQGFYGASRLDCIQDYVVNHGQPASTIQSIPDSLYKFDFASPVWSPDLAGWSLLLVGVFSLLLVVRVGFEYWLRNYVRDHV